MSVSEGLIHASLHGHVFGTLHVCLNNHNVFISGVQHKRFNYLVGVAKVSTERGFLVLRVYNWGWITIRYTE